MINLRSCHFLITAILFVDSVPAISQTPIYRVGVLMLGKPDRPQLRGLRDGLRDAGYTEGKNLRLEVPLKRTPDELRIVANRFVAEKKDAIPVRTSLSMALSFPMLQICIRWVAEGLGM